MSPGIDLVSRIWSELDADPARIMSVGAPARAIPLPSRLATADLAWASVAAAALAAGGTAERIAALDPERIALSYRSDRLLRIDGAAPTVWSPYSGFWRSADGWIRTHGNYPHHARALLSALHLADHAGAEEVAAALSVLPSRPAADAISHAGGLAVEVAREQPEFDAALREQPLLGTRMFEKEASRPRRARTNRTDSAAPLQGIRVLDLTRVIAGPVCTRTLAMLGADVLRIDAPHLPEPEWQHLDTGHGKRSALLDAHGSAVHALLDEADVVVLGYRPSALTRLGLSPDDLAERHPGLVVAQLSAWGTEHPARAGFDSLVQAESGIALIESTDGLRPGALPAQALDHSAGYLLAAAVCILLEQRRRDGGTRHVRTSLRRIAAELLGMPRRADPQPEDDLDPVPHTARFEVGGRIVETVRSALPDFELTAPRPWGRDLPTW